MIELIVSDTGIGIPKAMHQERCFRMSIPWQAAAGMDEPEGDAEDGASQTAVSATISGKPSSPTTGPLILVAEDNASNLSIILNILHFKGYRTVVAKDGAEAVALTHSSKPDLVLMDIQMPKMDGMETTRRLRESAETAVTPIIALTGLAMTGDKERILAAIANDYLSKPIRLKTLIEMIEQYLPDD
jgi:CheY-like chemotaxis protein